MIVYVGAGAGPFREHLAALGHGQLMGRERFARCSERTIPRCAWVFDNGAWPDYRAGRNFDGREYLHCMYKLRGVPESLWPQWCVTPDAVADRTSLNMSLNWAYHLPPDFSWLLAVQDGTKPEDLDDRLDEFAGIFVGGTTEWKWATAQEWVDLAHSHNKICHIGRVNGPKPLHQSIEIGADSVDGNGWLRAGRKWLPYLEACAPMHEPM